MTAVPNVTIRREPTWHAERFEFVAGVFRLTSMRRRAGPGDTRLFFLLAEQFAAQSIDEVKPVARLADYGFVG